MSLLYWRLTVASRSVIFTARSADRPRAAGLGYGAVDVSGLVSAPPMSPMDELAAERLAQGVLDILGQRRGHQTEHLGGLGHQGVSDRHGTRIRQRRPRTRT